MKWGMCVCVFVSPFLFLKKKKSKSSFSSVELHRGYFSFDSSAGFFRLGAICSEKNLPFFSFKSELSLRERHHPTPWRFKDRLPLWPQKEMPAVKPMRCTDAFGVGHKDSTCERGYGFQTAGLPLGGFVS